MKLVPWYASALALATVALGAVPQAQEVDAHERVARQVREDIDYARNLASRFGFLDLAEEILGGIEVDETDLELNAELGLARGRILTEGAKREGNREKKQKLYDRALVALEDVLGGDPRGELRTRALQEGIETCLAFGLALERAAAESVAAEAAVARNRACEVLVTGAGYCEALLEQYSGNEGRNELLARDRVLYQQAHVLVVLGRCTNGGTFHFARAEKILEDLAMGAGNGPLAMFAYLLLGECAYAQDEYYDATAFGEFVVNAMVPLTAEDREFLEWDETPIEFKRKRWTLVEQGIETLLRSHLARGANDAAAAWALHYYTSWRRDGFALSGRGLTALVEVGRTLHTTGGWAGGIVGGEGNLSWFATESELHAAGYEGRREAHRVVDLALAIATHVNDAGRGTTLERQVKALLDELIGRSDVTPHPDLLLEVVEGRFRAADYPGSIAGTKSVLRALDARDEAERRTIAPRALDWLGRSLRQLDRPLEAAMAHREAVRRWSGDDETDARNIRGFYGAIRQVRRGARGDERIEELWREAGELVATLGGSEASDVAWSAAEREFRAGNYQAARNRYAAVESGSKFRDSAVVRAALCLYRLGEAAAAAGELRAFLAPIDAPAPRPGDEALLRRRRDAEAVATYYLGRIAHEGGDHAGTIERLGDYTTRFPSAGDDAANALYLLLLSQLALGQSAPAQATHAALREHFPTHDLTERSAFRMYELAKIEHAAAIDAGREDEAAALVHEMAGLLHLANSLATTPAFANLHHETRLWMEIEDWERVAETAARNRALFAADAEHGADVTRLVLPDLGRGLVHLKLLHEAFAVLDPLVPDPDEARRTSSTVTRSWCRAACGWLEGDATSVIVVPGVGEAADLEKASVLWRRLADQAGRDDGKWGPEWYEHKFQELYCHYLWGTLESVRMNACRSGLLALRADAGDNFEDVRETCGDDVLASRFRWLWKRVR